MRRFACALVVSAALLYAAGEGSGRRWWSYVEALANDQMQGRETGSEAHRKAAAYVAAQFERDGLKAAGTQGFFQPVAFRGRKLVEAESSLDLIRNGKAERLKSGEDAYIGVRVDPAES